jgi:hypothetical protein
MVEVKRLKFMNESLLKELSRISRKKNDFSVDKWIKLSF